MAHKLAWLSFAKMHWEAHEKNEQHFLNFISKILTFHIVILRQEFQWSKTMQQILP